MHVSLDMSYLDRGTVAKSVSPEQPDGKTMQDRNGKFLRIIRKELNLRSANYSPLAHFNAAVSDIKSKICHAMNKNASLVMDLSGQELKKVVRVFFRLAVSVFQWNTFRVCATNYTVLRMLCQTKKSIGLICYVMMHDSRLV